MNQTKMVRLTVLLFLFSGLIFICTVLFYDRLLVRYFLIWNIFLASVPLLLSWGLYFCRKSKLLSVGLGFTWLLFFPNGPYMLTDLIHLNRYYYHRPTLSSPIYFDDWLGLVHLSFGIFIGVTMGLLSLYMMHQILKENRGGLFSWLFVGLVCFISGSAIYVGRFMRFNSWDVISNPSGLLYDIYQQNFVEFVLFSLLFAAMTILFYLVFYVCMGQQKN